MCLCWIPGLATILQGKKLRVGTLYNSEKWDMLRVAGMGVGRSMGRDGNSRGGTEMVFVRKCFFLAQSDMEVSLLRETSPFFYKLHESELCVREKWSHTLLCIPWSKNIVVENLKGKQFDFSISLAIYFQYYSTVGPSLLSVCPYLPHLSFPNGFI